MLTETGIVDLRVTVGLVGYDQVNHGWPYGVDELPQCQKGSVLIRRLWDSEMEAFRSPRYLPEKFCIPQVAKIESRAQKPHD